MKKNITTIIRLFTTLLLFTRCSGSSDNSEVVLTASISPIKYLVETITCGDFPVKVLVPDGASPETYSPTAIQMVDIENSEFIFTTGLLDFEKELVQKLSGDPTRIINLSKGINLIEGSCSHANSARNQNHAHGVDPHIWTSPEQLKLMATNVHEAVKRQFLDSVKYDISYRKLLTELDLLSNKIRDKVEKSPTRYFVIYHPALTYYANDYGLEQVSLENEGKEPSAVHMENVIKIAREQKIKHILYQKQFFKSVVETISADINATPVEIDPLREDITDEILRITDIITAK